MITFRKVREDDLELNSKIEDLNIKVFPSTETTSDLHQVYGIHLYDKFLPRLFYLLPGHRTRVSE